MKVRVHGGDVVEAEITIDHSAWNFGKPLLVIDGRAYGVSDSKGIELVEATDEERQVLHTAGYRLAATVED